MGDAGRLGGAGGEVGDAACRGEAGLGLREGRDGIVYGTEGDEVEEAICREGFSAGGPDLCGEVEGADDLGGGRLIFWSGIRRG